MPDRPRYWPFPWDPPKEEAPKPTIKEPPRGVELRPAPSRWDVKEYIPSVREALANREGIIRPLLQTVQDFALPSFDFENDPLGGVGEFKGVGDAAAGLPPIFNKVKGMFSKGAQKVAAKIPPPVPIPKRMARTPREDPIKVLGEIKATGKQEFDKLVTQVSLLRQKAREQGGLLGQDLGKLKRLQNQMMKHEAMPPDIGKRLAIRGRVARPKPPTSGGAEAGGLKPPEALAGVPPEGPPPSLLVEGAGGKPKPPESKLKYGLLESFAFPKSVMASWDASAPFRQGLMFAGRKEFWKNLHPMFKAMRSEKYYQELQSEIVNRASFPHMKRNRLALTELTANRKKREEHFLSEVAEKYVPGVRPSSRAYTAFLNKTRADVYDSLADKFKGLGIDVAKDKVAGRSLASYINNATGRGEFGRFEGAVQLLNNVFFSPRLIASRVRLLNPMTYAKMHPEVRKEALKDVLKIAIGVNTVGGLAKFAGADFKWDPRHSDFGKVIIGNSSVDLTGGAGLYLRAAAQVATGQYQTRGREMRDLGPDIGQRSRTDVAINTVENKLAPAASFFWTLMKGRDFDGMPISVKTELWNRLHPIITQDIIDIAKEDPKLLPLMIPSALGASVQTYEPKYPKSRRRQRRGRSR